MAANPNDTSKKSFVPPKRAVGKKALRHVPAVEENGKPVIIPTHPHRRIYSYEKYIIPVILLIVLLLVLVTGYIKIASEKRVETAIDQREVQSLLKEVGEHVILPEGEQATITTVSDVTQLEKTDFFKDAQNGDKVLIYPQAKKAYLYRPSIKKVVATGPVNDGEGERSEVAGSSASTTPAVQGAQTEAQVSQTPSTTPQASSLAH